MNILIVEDEAHAVAKLERLLNQHYPTSQIVGKENSVHGAVKWLEKNSADLIFLDVQLSDGLCFEIFKMTQVKPKVIITTAFDQYAIAAFKVGSVDYILKPIDDDEFVAAVERCKTLMKTDNSDANSKFISILDPSAYKTRFTTKIGDRINVIETKDIAYFVSEDKFSFIVTFDSKRHILDQSLDTVEDNLSPVDFFRTSRSCIVNFKAIRSVNKYLGGRLKLLLQPEPSNEDTMIVSRSRVPSLLKWLEGEISSE